MKLSDIGEFGLISEIASASSPGPGRVVGIGDDCAVMPRNDGFDTLVSTDMLVEDVHFILDDIPPELLGWKSASVNISDIAAMGGQPEAAFLSFALPETLSLDYIRAFLDGFRKALDCFGLSLLGGDTTSSPDKLSISVTVIGHCKSGTARLRSGALPGDLVCVTGCLGDSAAGLRIILEGLPRSGPSSELVLRHYRPQPRVNQGLLLSTCPGVHAMMDISDGIASDLVHILKASHLSARIDLGNIPLSGELLSVCSENGWNPLEFALEGGEDYELLFTIDSQSEAGLAIPHTIVGQLFSGESGKVDWLGNGADHTDFQYKGYTHF